MFNTQTQIKSNNFNHNKCMTNPKHKFETILLKKKSNILVISNNEGCQVQEANH